MTTEVILLSWTPSRCCYCILSVRTRNSGHFLNGLLKQKKIVQRIEHLLSSSTNIIRLRIMYVFLLRISLVLLRSQKSLERGGSKNESSIYHCTNCCSVCVLTSCIPFNSSYR